MSMSDQMVNGDGLELLKKFEKHRPNQIKKKPITKFKVVCPKCGSAFLLNDKTIFVWDNIISVECPSCKHEEMY